MKLRGLLISVTVFAIGMAFLESAVVVYIRELLYPEGFTFPLAIMEGSLALTEILRELATLIMLLTIAIIAGSSFSTRFAWFLYSFAVWDIFYYVFLKLLIGWPEGLFTWDVLFLIPVTWTGPVISPLIECFIMIALFAVIVYYSDKKVDTRINLSEWVLLIAGAVIVIVAFTWDYSGYILEEYTLSDIWNLPDNNSLLEYATGYIPRKFNWWLYSAGNLVIVSAVYLVYRRLSDRNAKLRVPDHKS